jgi:hypothetical protein
MLALAASQQPNEDTRCFTSLISADKLAGHNIEHRQLAAAEAIRVDADQESQVEQFGDNLRRMPDHHVFSRLMRLERTNVKWL